MRNLFKYLTQWGVGIIAFVTLFSLNTTAKETVKLTDPEIASVAVTANQIDVKYGEIALKKSKNAEVRKFAETMVNDHNSIIKQATDLAKKLGVTPKDNPVSQSLVKGEKEIIAKFSKLSGNAFDKAYIANEVAYHEAIIKTVKDVLIPQTQNSQLKDLLVKASPLLEHHLEMAKEAKAKVK